MIFSALGFPQDEATVDVDIHNQAVCLVIALEGSANLLLVNMHSPRKFIIPAFAGPVHILSTVLRSPLCGGLTRRLDHHPEHSISSLPGEELQVVEYDPYHTRIPFTHTAFPFDPISDLITS